MFFYLLISYAYSLYILNLSGFLHDNSSFKLITHSIKSQRQVHVHFTISISKALYFKGRLGRISVRIWLDSVVTNFNIISQEYDNKKDVIFLDVLFLTFSDSSFLKPADKLTWKGLCNQIRPDIMMFVI